MTCVMCQGKLESKKIKYTSDIGECVLIIKDVPADVCSQCGETYFDDDVFAEIESIVDVARKSSSEIYITNYTVASEIQKVA